MKAVTWQGRQDMQVIEVPDPVIEQPTDVLVEVTSTGLCGSDLHLHDPLTPFMTEGDVVGHEPMGVVREVGSGTGASLFGYSKLYGQVLDLLRQDEDVLGVESFATHHLPLDDAPGAYRKFRDKEDGTVKVVFTP